jgi:hypothetical protein
MTADKPVVKPARATRSDKGQRRLIQRDLDTLRLIGEQYTYRFDQLQQVLARHPETTCEDQDCLSETRTREAINKWKQLGLADGRKILVGEPSYVWLTRRGLHHLQLDVAFWEPEHTNLQHYYWCNEVRASLVGEHPGSEWESERLWRVKRDRWENEQKHSPHIEIPWEYRGKHRPDAILRYQQDGEDWLVAIEVELTAKSYPTWKTIFNEVVRCHDAVWYYAPRSVRGSLQRAVAQYRAEQPRYQEPDTEARERLHIYALEEIEAQI